MLALASLVFAVQAVGAPPPPDAQTILRALQRSSEFGPDSGRVGLSIGELRVYPESGEPRGCLVDVSWTEEGAFGEEEDLSGVATVERIDALEPGTTILGQEGGWAFIDFLDQQTRDELQADLAVMRARAAEANAVGDLRAVLIAQTVFAESAGGRVYAGELRCLARPRECLGVDSAPDAPLLGESQLATERAGYRFVLGGTPSAGRRGGLVDSFTFVAVPLPGGPGQRSFCVDDSGRLCQVEDGSVPTTVGGRCAPSCLTLGR